MNFVSRKTEVRASYFFISLLFFAAGHLFLLPAVAQASTSQPNQGVHYDVAPHEDKEEHVECSQGAYQFLSVRLGGSFSEVYDFVGDNLLSNTTKRIALSGTFGTIIRPGQNTPPLLPLSLKTQFRI